MPLIEVRALSHQFDDGTLGLDRIDLTIEDGSFCVVSGRNGSGKTLLMRHLNGLVQPTQGQVLFDSVPIKHNLALVRQRIGLLFQESDAQILGQTVAQDVAFGPQNLRLTHTEIERRVTEALHATSLTALRDRRPHTLSGGQKRRLAIAGVLAMQPAVLVLDEPFHGLDWPGCADLLAVLDRLHRTKTTIVVITHDLGKVLSHADTLVLIDSGRIQASGAPSQLIAEVERFGVHRPAGSVAEMTWARA